MYFDIEVEEAVNAGEKVLDTIDLVKEKLSSARIWGFIDLFSKNGFISGLVKHSSLNEAQKYMDRLRTDLERFNDELDDIEIIESTEDFRFDSFARFADLFLDNFIFDFMAITKINESIRQIEQLEDEVTKVLDRLERFQEDI